MVLITIVTGAYKPTYNWGASHCTNNSFILVLLPFAELYLEGLGRLVSRFSVPYPIPWLVQYSGHQELKNSFFFPVQTNSMWDRQVLSVALESYLTNSYICLQIFYLTPYAPYMEYLPTFARTKSPSFKGKYTIHRAYGNAITEHG